MNGTPDDLQALQAAIQQQHDTADAYVRCSSLMLLCSGLALMLVGGLWLLTGDGVLGVGTAVLLCTTAAGAVIRWHVGRLRRSMR